MNFFYVKIFSLLFVLRICEVFHTSEINILKYKHGKKMCAEKFIFVRSLSEEVKEKNLNTKIAECDLIYDILEKFKSLKYRNLINNREIDSYHKRKKQKEKKLQDKIIRQKMKEYYKLKDKLIIDKSFGTPEYNEVIARITKTKIKDKLYKMIFKGKGFWRNLSYTIRTLGVASAVTLYLGIIGASCGLSGWVAVLGIWSVFVFLLIIIIVGTWFLATWLWPHRDTYNEKYRV
ncbi:hypothetical protein CYL21_2172 [Plasmodium falciparum NF54]|uniref:Uncharacterized protein n=2 Tax=Plasmodium falciparum TaxID=5833 RepID=A0A144A5J7_PLAF7|nr:Plasmodium exported protein (hyp15), unknown function [Plasmodium falciparum 3D7]KAF4329021.1 hypothetical protein CYL21_2172 [Plasmodium falciparum NF54]PKC49997.1 hypothetical protein CK202_0746 [Plasmodium falciparum NF54]CZU00468.1 Plasmodium exported protein (hyp15), unknown function [Plasmodium falciparum 3D7]|eukprot:XP_024329216.1 Plasmodium exported protein (hyp15), unknown function [Plasmodium falciparum 3D7]